MRFYLALILMLNLMIPVLAQADNIEVVVSGRWGDNTDQIGIRFPSPGVMPVAPYQCLGGFDVDNDGTLWVTDSVNRMLKRYHKREWSQVLLNIDKMGDISCYKGRLYIVTRSPDGVAIVDPDNGKIERQLRIGFNNPGRIKVFAEDLVGVEEPGVGLWLCRAGQASLHPASSLEAVGDTSAIYGLQYDLDPASRTIVKAELATQPQEPETIALFEAGDNIVYSKTAGLLGDRPVFIFVTQARSQFINIYLLTDGQMHKRAELPVFDAPFLPTAWKLCSDGKFYGFAGNAREGFKLYRYAGRL